MSNDTNKSSEEEKEIENKKFFGYFWDYLCKEELRNLDYESNELWASYSSGRRVRLPKDENITPSFLEAFCNRARNSISGEFSQHDVKLETEFNTFRITMVHEQVSKNGRTINIRKVSEKPVYTTKELIAAEYISKPAINFLVNCIKARCVIAVAGIPDVGKTEFAKYLSTFIPPYEKVITIESRKEWFFKKFMPDNDCISLQTSASLSESDAIKLALSLNAKWLMFQEARSSEANELVTGWSSGIPGITTMHALDATKIPSRIVEMCGNGTRAEYRLNEIYEHLDIGLHMRWKIMPDGSQQRFVAQIALYTNDGQNNKVTLLVNNGKLVETNIPTDLKNKFEYAGISNPFVCTRLDEIYWPSPKDIVPRKEVC